MKFLLILLALAAPLHAQVVEISGGTSTLFNASGGLVTIHLPESTFLVSAGAANGHFGFGFAEERAWRGWDITLGDKSFSGGNVGLVTRGVSLSRKHITIFAGGTGPSYAVPYFSTASTQHIGLGIFYHGEFRGLNFDTLAAVAGGQRTVVESLAYRWRVLRLSGAGGVLQNVRYWNASLGIQPTRSVGFQAARVSYPFVTVDSISASARLSVFNFHASAFAGGHASGETAGISTRISFVDAGVDYFHSRFGANVSGRIGERIGRHWHFDQFVSENQGHLGLNFGGGYTSNRFTVSIGQATYFMPLYVGRAPFQQSVTVSLSFRAPHDTTINLQTNLDQTGKLRWGAYATSFEELNMPQNSKLILRASVHGHFVVIGKVTNQSGMPVLGACVYVGNQPAYTDSAGSFLVRFKNARRQPIRVAPEEFSAPGLWHVLHAPDSADPAPEATAKPLIIVVGQVNGGY